MLKLFQIINSIELIKTMYEELLAPINAFLKCETPEPWVEEAKKTENLPILLRDHLICEQ